MITDSLETLRYMDEPQALCLRSKVGVADRKKSGCGFHIFTCTKHGLISGNPLYQIHCNLLWVACNGAWRNFLCSKVEERGTLFTKRDIIHWWIMSTGQNTLVNYVRGDKIHRRSRSIPRICTWGFLTISTRLCTQWKSKKHTHHYMKVCPYWR